MLCFASVAARAEDKKDYALIYGTVLSADGRTMSGVPIKIERVGDKKPKWELVSDHRGEFAQRVPVGDHEYRVIRRHQAPERREEGQKQRSTSSKTNARISRYI